MFAYLLIKNTKEAVKRHETAVSKTLTIRLQRAGVSEKRVATPTILRDSRPRPRRGELN